MILVIWAFMSVADWSMNSAAPTATPDFLRMSPKASTAPRPQSVLTARKSACLIPKSFRYFSRPRASISLGGLMRKIHGLPRLVMVAALEVSTTIGTPYSSSLGMAASVIELPQAPTMTGTLSRTISFSAAVAASLGSDLLSSISSSILRPSTPPLRVDPVAGDLGAHPDVVAGGGHRARQGLDHADLHGLLRLHGRRADGEHDCQRNGKGSDCSRHDRSPLALHLF